MKVDNADLYKQAAVMNMERSLTAGTRRWNIKQWNLTRPDPYSNWAMTGYQSCTLDINFNNKTYIVTYPDGSRVNGKILVYLEYPSAMPGVFGFADATTGKPFLFGETTLVNGFWPVGQVPLNGKFLLLSHPPDLAYPNTGYSLGLRQMVSNGAKDLGGWRGSQSRTGLSNQVPGGSPVPPICYLKGTLVATPDGERAIESLKPGDEITVLRHGIKKTEQVIWVGQGFMQVSIEIERPDEAGYPICIRKDTIAPGNPHTDLYVTSEHSMYFDNCFVPARMLVNGESIFYDTNIYEYSYFHVETISHNVIFANGSMSESFLDTGNKPHMLGSYLAGIDVAKRHSQTWADACAPLCVDRNTVEPLWQQFANHNPFKINISEFCPKSFNIMLRSKENIEIYPTRTKESTYIFRLTRVSSIYSLISSRIRPCDIIGPYIDDRRYFGLFVSKIVVWGPSRFYEVDLDDMVRQCAGWYTDTQENGYWTNGEAQFLLDEEDGPIVVSITARSYISTILNDYDNTISCQTQAS